MHHNERTPERAPTALAPAKPRSDDPRSLTERATAYRAERDLASSNLWGNHPDTPTASMLRRAAELIEGTPAR